MLARLAAIALIAPLILTAPASADLITDDVQLIPAGAYVLPVGIEPHPTDDVYYVVQKVGLIHAVRGGVLDPVPVLSVVGEVSNNLEQGLLGMAVAPEGDKFYVNMTDIAGDTRILEYSFNLLGYADILSRREVMMLDQPFSNHNAGHLDFGPDGYLYAALGDGGSGGDPQGNGQNLGSLLGSLLRIDPTPDGDAAYTIPASNPFVGVDGAREEIWAYGLRNPWKFAFDRDTGDLWIGDVGQNLYEEIDFQPASSAGGENYGWNEMEGFHTYDGGTAPENHVPPVWEYGHAGGACSITGGYVYRGDDVPSLQGAYIYSDWCEGSIHALRNVDGQWVDEDLGLDVPQIAAFGEDADGELYAISLAGPVFRFASIL